jgi:hypothetical protein
MEHAKAALYLYSSRNIPGKDAPTYEQLERSLEIAKREISISYETRNLRVEEAGNLLRFSAKLYKNSTSATGPRFILPSVTICATHGNVCLHKLWCSVVLIYTFQSSVHICGIHMSHHHHR